MSVKSVNCASYYCGTSGFPA